MIDIESIYAELEAEIEAAAAEFDTTPSDLVAAAASRGMITRIKMRKSITLRSIQRIRAFIADERARRAAKPLPRRRRRRSCVHSVIA